MNKVTINVLLIEDSPTYALLVQEILADAEQINPLVPNFDLVHVKTLSEGVKQLSQGRVDVILLDLELPDSKGVMTFEQAISSAPDVPIIVLSSLDDDELAIRILHAGAQEYLVKGDTNAPFLKRAIRHAIGGQRLKQDLAQRTRELQASEATFHRLIEEMADGIVIVDAVGNLCFLNVAAEALFGRSAEELIGEPFGFPVVVGDTTELEIISRSGINRFAEMRVVEIVWEGQKANLASLRDITNQKKISQKLQESEKRYRTLAEAAQDFIFIINRELKVQYVNSFGAMSFGKQPEDLIGKPLEILFPQSVDQQAESLKRVFQTGEAIYRENSFKFPGQTIWLGTQLSPIQAANGETSAVLGLARNITQRKQAEIALCENEERHRTLLEQLPIGVSLLDQDRKLVFANQSLSKILEIPFEELYQGKYQNRQYIRPDGSPMPPDEFASMRAFNEQQPVRDIETGMILENGKTIWTSVSAAPYALADKSIVVATVDISKRKQMELAVQEYSERLEEMVAERTRELQAAQDQLVRQEKLAVLGQLAGGLAHELRTPLNTIKNGIYFFKNAISHPDDDSIEMLTIINNAINDSDRIISSVLHFARPQAQTFHPVLLAGILKAALAQSPIPENITIQIDVDETLAIIADPNYMEITFSNLIRNALQAMPGGGHLEIHAKVQPETDETPGYISIAIRDTGTGIADDVLPRLFEPLFSTKIKGIGLGLIISKMMVEAHDGRIDVASVPGEGSTFVVVLPMHSNLARSIS